MWWALLAFTIVLFGIAFIARNLPHARRRARVMTGAAPEAVDRWRSANELAGQGNWLEALHALFAAVIAALGSGRELDPHPAKTVGDYVRELRESGSRRAAPFRAFALEYEQAVYGAGDVSRETWESLATTARRLAGDRR